MYTSTAKEDAHVWPEKKGANVGIYVCIYIYSERAELTKVEVEVDAGRERRPEAL
jgi:hypothetical protein